MTTATTGSPPTIGEMPVATSGAHWSVVHLGDPADLRRYGILHPASARPFLGKVFLKELLGLTGMEISFGVMPPRAAASFKHKHKENEEVYLFLRGSGQMLLDDVPVDVAPGTAVRIAPEGVRTWRSTSDEPLFYVVIQAKEGTLTQWTLTDGVGVHEPIVWPT